MKAAILRFVSEDAPCYALEVHGPWGAGKTHQVRAALDGHEHIYVSLANVATAGEAYLAISTEVLGSKLASKEESGSSGKWFATLAQSAQKVPAIKALVPSAAIVARKLCPEGAIVVFDDIERTSIPPKLLVGLLNDFVEHHQARVIVINNAEKVEGHALFEKFVGQRVEVIPQAASALKSFVDELDEGDATTWINDNRSLVERIFIATGVSSLRILRRGVRTLHRFVSSMGVDFTAHEAASRTICGTFISLAFLYYDEQLEAEELTDRLTRLYAPLSDELSEGMPRGSAVLQRCSEALKGVDLADASVPDADLVSILARGQPCRDGLAETVLSSVHFGKVDLAPGWQQLTGIRELPEADAARAVGVIRDQLAGGKLLHPGDILHSAAYLFLLASEGVISDSLSEAVATTSRYIDDNSGQIWIEGYELAREGGLRDSSFAGWAYWVTEATEASFGSLVNRLEGVLANNRAKRRTAQAMHLFKSLKVDAASTLSELMELELQVREFKLCSLTCIEAGTFAAAWLAMPSERLSVLADILRTPWLAGTDENRDHTWTRAVLELLRDELKVVEERTIKKLHLSLCISDVERSLPGVH